MKNKDFIHYAKHESGAYMYTTKEPDGDYVLHYLNPHGYEQICGATLEKLQKGTTLQPWYVSDKIYNQLLNEIAAQAKGKPTFQAETTLLLPVVTVSRISLRSALKNAINT